MARNLASIAVLCIWAACHAIPASAQGRPDAARVLAAQRDAMAALKSMDGVWRGPAWTILPSGEKHNIVQTERIGPLLDGSIKVIEGRGYQPDGSLAFNSFGVISFNPSTGAYSLRSHAMGQAGDFPFTPTADGYTWEIPAGPATIRYTAVIKGGMLRSVGDRVMPGQAPFRFFEMTLQRAGDSDWPAAGAVGPK